MCTRRRSVLGVRRRRFANRARRRIHGRLQTFSSCRARTTGLTMTAKNPASWKRLRFCCAGARQHDHRGVPQFAVAGDLARERQSVHLRHHVVDERETIRIASGRRSAQCRHAIAASPTHSCSMRQLVSCRASTRRLISRSSTTSTRPGVANVGGSISVADGATRSGKRNQNVEPPPSRPLHADLAAHQLDQALADREAQSGAAVAPRRRRVGLAEALEQHVLTVSRHADARVADLNSRCCVAGGIADDACSSSRTATCT